jgi:FkbM family methyltransferase
LNCCFSNIVSGLGSSFGAKSLPSHFNGRWVRFSPKCWAGLEQKYEPYMARAIQAELGPGGVFLDVGSHFGLWSVYAARIVGTTGKVFAFEPSPAFEVLRENAALNSSIQAFNIGVGARNGDAMFFDQGQASSGSFVSEVTKINERFQPSVPIDGKKVKIYTLDTLVEELGVRPDLIKMDVEGFEFEVTRGAENVLRNVHPALLIEVHPPQLKLSGSCDQALFDLLRSEGYAFEEIDRNPNSIYTVLAKRMTDGSCPA